MFSAGLLATVASIDCSAQLLVRDNFDNGIVTDVSTMRNFWHVSVLDGNTASSADEFSGKLSLRAVDWSNSSVSLTSSVLMDMGFFERPITITLEGIDLQADGIKPEEARLRLSLTPTGGRVVEAADAISLRYRPGVLLLGCRINGAGRKLPVESLSGVAAPSIMYAPLPEGKLEQLSLTIGPGDTPGMLRYQVVAKGDNIDFEQRGTFNMSLAQWGGVNGASLTVEVRRDAPASVNGTAAILNLKSLTVTR